MLLEQNIGEDFFPGETGEGEEYYQCSQEDCQQTEIQLSSK